MWLDGLSASQIAKALGTGRSRNAVIGRVHRHGLPMRLDPKRSYKKNRRAPYIKPTRKVIYTPVSQPARVRAPTINPKAPKVRDPVALVESLNVPFLELQAFQCKAVTDDTRYAQKFCGHFRANDSVYCAAHAALYAAPPQVKGKAA